ncbi:MAG: HAD hydrolase family protein [Eggerthellaceae bacterium]|nr:HAD hydrolase family protein [Eggerthellaceae bacterium]
MIDHIIFDVDGTLTDGGITISSNGVESKQFQAKDGLLVRVLPKLGFTTMILTGRNSELTAIRAKDLAISVVFQGVNNKIEVLEQYFLEHGLTGANFAYIGDDLNDYEAMQMCAFKACPADATREIRRICDYISPIKAGHGAVRDICEHLLYEQNQYDDMLALFGCETLEKI